MFPGHLLRRKTLKRDMALIREILLQLESGKLSRDSISIGEWDTEEVIYHKYLIMDAGLATGMHSNTLSDEDYHLNRLTNKGHDFVDAARSKTIWKTAQDKVLQIGGAITIETMINLLKKIINDQLGL